MKFAFRVDASLKIGTGHVMRCLTLAEALRAHGGTCQFITRLHSGNLVEVIRQCGFPVIELPKGMTDFQPSMLDDESPFPTHAHWLGCDWAVDAKESLEALQAIQPDWLVVDHYALDQRWEAALGLHYQKLLVIDDLADRTHQCDLLLDQNLGRQPQGYANLVPAQCKVLIGPQYALLRPEFASLRAYSLQRRQQPVLKQLLITMGGVDQLNATGQVLQALKYCALPQDCRISVVMGSQAPWLQQVQVQAQGMPWPTEVLVNINDMAQRMADSDLAIGAAGSTSWERCCLGLPTWIVVLAENQRAIADALQGAGAAKILDSASIAPMTCELFTGLMSDIRTLTDMSIAAASVVDGLGTARLVSYLSVLDQL